MQTCLSGDQEVSRKEQEKVAELNRVKVELQEQIGNLQVERTAQGALREKIAALEREMKGEPSRTCPSTQLSGRWRHRLTSWPVYLLFPPYYSLGWLWIAAALTQQLKMGQ